MRLIDPPRLRDAEGAPRLLRIALESRADEPSASDLDGLAASLGVGAASAPASGSGVLALLKSKVLTVIIAPVLVGGATALAVVKMSSSRPDSPMTLPTVSTVEVPELSATPLAAAPKMTAPLTSASAPPRTPVASKERVEAKRIEETADDRQESAPPPAPVFAQEAPESEVALLDRAKSLVDSNPGGALALVNEHAARFPNGMLGQEAEVIAIESLVRAGNRAAAYERLDRFRRTFANSAYLPHLEAAVRHPN
jgi:hypothetical protein